jgi:hypothetical protein
MKPKLHFSKKNLSDFSSLTLLLFILLVGIISDVNAQTNHFAYINVIKQPCNGDGVLAVNYVTGLTPPLTYEYGLSNYSTITHSNTNALNDTLFNIESTIRYVSITETTNNPQSIYIDTVGIVDPFQINNPTITAAICPSLNGSAVITINNGAAPGKVEWFQNSATTYMAYVGVGNPMNLAVGVYRAKVYNNNGCYAYYDSMYVSNISPITFSVITTDANCTNGTASVTSISGGVAPYSFDWANGAHSSQINNLVTGNYDVKVTDAQGCYSQSYASINQAININVNTTVTDATCIQNDGQIIAFASGGTPPYQYTYSNGTNGQTASKLQGGQSLNIDVIDAKSCKGTGYAYVAINTPVNVNYSANASKCTQPTGSATLNISGGTQPYTVVWNTYPAQTGAGISNMASGQYDFEVTDGAGCKRSGTVFIPQESTLTLSINSTNPICPQTTGSSFVSVNGNKPPFTYLWSSGEITDNINNAPIGSYSCQVTDNVGCKLTKYTYISQTSPLTININSTAASCKFAADGSITATAIGGTAPYTYNWSNGQTAATATNLISGNYNVYATDVYGCSGSNYDFVDYNHSDSSCFCVLKGKVYVDANSNCQYDISETGVENIMMHCSANGYTFTDANGNYSFIVPSGNYTLSEAVQYFYPLANCQSNSIAINSTATTGCKITNDFANIINPIHDVHVIRTNVNPPIPGFSYKQRVIIQNDGTINEAAILSDAGLDNQILLDGTNPSSYVLSHSIPNVNLYNNSSALLSLSPQQYQVFDFDYQVPTNIPLNTILNFNDTVAYLAPIENWLADYTPWNNVENYRPLVIGSFDPNMKEVFPAGTGSEGFIEDKDTLLDYVIHFQNTGSYYAQKVVVLDTLDANLDWTSLKLGYADHNYTAELSENGILKFTFNNIQLIWQSQSEIASRGMVSYTITRKKNLAPGTKITKASAIYFDYNAPVITNRAISTISYSVATSIKNESSSDSKMIVYPNPASTEINVQLKVGEVFLITIYDTQGRVIQQINGNKNTVIQKIDLLNLINGIYFIEVVKTDGSKLSEKFIISN